MPQLIAIVLISILAIVTHVNRSNNKTDNDCKTNSTHDTYKKESMSNEELDNLIDEVESLIAKAHENYDDKFLFEDYMREAGIELLSIEDVKLREIIASRFNPNPLNYI